MNCPTCNGKYRGRVRNGEGSTTADQLHSVGKLHADIINAMLSTTTSWSLMDAQIIHKESNAYRILNKKPIISYGSFHARHSELMRKGIFVMVRKDKTVINKESQPRTIVVPLYAFNREVALEALRSGKF